MKTRRFASLIVSVIACLLIAADAPQVKPDVKIVSLQISNPPDKQIDGLFLQSKGVKLQLLISDPNRTIIGMADEACKVTRFSDDKNTDLVKSDFPAGFQLSPLRFAQPASDGHSMSVNLESDAVPVAGAARIQAVGLIVIQCGSDPKTDKTADVALTMGTSLKLGDVPATINVVSDGGTGDDDKMQVTFHSTQSIRAIKSLRFLKSDGTEIKSRFFGGTTMSIGPTPSFDSTYSLAEKVAKATVEVTWWGQVEKVEIPLNLDVGLGF